MREVSGPGDPLAPGLSPGGWLHLDVSFGCAGDMLTAALLDLGVGQGVLRAGLADAGLFTVGPRLSREARGGIAGVRLELVDGAGRSLDAPLEPSTRRARAASTRGRRRATPRLDAQQAGPAPRAGIALDEQGPGVAPPGEGDDEERAPLGGQVVAGPRGGRRPPPRDAVERWLAGEAALAEALLGQLAHSRLSPIAKALAHKALRRALTSLAAVSGAPFEELSLPGRPAVDLLCDIVGFSSLLAALEPARVTASPVAVSTAPVRLFDAVVPGPSPWVLAALEGAWLCEMDAGYEVTTPTGAALVWSVVHRYGPRGLFTPARAGVGLGTRAPAGRANLCRALYGPLPEGPTRAGRAEAGAATFVSAQLGPGEDPARLEEALVRLGASALSFGARLSASGRPVRDVACAMPATALDEGVRALFALGDAREVWAMPGERRRPQLHTVTIRIGRGNKWVTVRVHERADAGALLSAEPDEEDVREAARALGLSVAAARADALTAYARLSRGAPQEGDG